MKNNALYTCIRNGALTCAALILDQGMDFEQFLSWAERHGVCDNYPEAMEELEAHWAEQHPAQEQGMGGMGGIS